MLKLQAEVFYRRKRRFLNKICEKSGQHNRQNLETYKSQVLPEINTHCEPKKLTNNILEKNQTNSPSQTSPVVTRSGCEVKPSKLYQGHKWTT